MPTQTAAHYFLIDNLTSSNHHLFERAATTFKSGIKKALPSKVSKATTVLFQNSLDTYTIYIAYILKIIVTSWLKEVDTEIQHIQSPC